MFVDITHPLSPLACENLLHPYKCGKEKLTEEACFLVLTASNYPRTMRSLASLIEKDDEPGRFQEAVLAMVDQREQPEDVFARLKALADKNGFGEMFGMTVQKPLENDVRLRLLAAPERKMACELHGYNCDVFPSLDDCDALRISGVESFILDGRKYSLPPEWVLDGICSKFYVYNLDMAGVEKLTIRAAPGERVVLINNGKAFPKEIALASELQHLLFYKCQFNGLEKIDLSRCESVYLQECRLDQLPETAFKGGGQVYLDTNNDDVPAWMDFRRCRGICLNNKHLRAPYAVLAAFSAEAADEVVLTGYRLKGETVARFKDGAKVSLKDCDVQQNLAFGNGEDVRLDGCILPKEMVFGNIAALEISNSDFINTQTVWFHNRETMDKFVAHFPICLAVKVLPKGGGKREAAMRFGKGGR